MVLVVRIIGIGISEVSVEIDIMAVKDGDREGGVESRGSLWRRRSRRYLQGVLRYMRGL